MWGMLETRKNVANDERINAEPKASWRLDGDMNLIDQIDGTRKRDVDDSNLIKYRGFLNFKTLKG